MVCVYTLFARYSPLYVPNLGLNRSHSPLGSHWSTRRPSNHPSIRWLLLDFLFFPHFIYLSIHPPRTPIHYQHASMASGSSNRPNLDRRDSSNYMPSVLPSGVDPSAVDFREFFPYIPNEVKHRKRTTQAQLETLEQTFSCDKKPNGPLRAALARELDMTPRGVQVCLALVLHVVRPLIASCFCPGLVSKQVCFTPESRRWIKVLT